MKNYRAVPIADWKDPSVYPPAGEATLLPRWHWEFLRRNLEYQADYDTYAALPDDAESRWRKRELARKYGLDEIMFDYRDSLEQLFQSPRDPASIRTVQWRTGWVEDRDGNLVEGHLKNMEYLDPRIRQHECIVVFNLRHPVDLQLESARHFLEREQRRFEDKRGRIADYPLYLRLLDADATGADYDEIAAVIYPEVEIRIARKRIEEDLKLAKRLRDVNYRYI